MHAVDKWVRTTFLALVFSRFDGESTLPPQAVNAHRWLANTKNTQRMVLKIMSTRFVAIILLALIISACSSATQSPLLTETLQSTIEPTFTQLHPAFTPEPENTPTFVPTNETKSSMGTPIPDWEGIPLIPGANEGEPAGFGYIYSVNVTVEEAEKFYIEKMESEDWTLFNKQTSETSMFGGPSTILDFQRNNEEVNIMLIFSSTDNFTMVMLTQVKP
jgi:hypothetical protein